MKNYPKKFNAENAKRKKRNNTYKRERKTEGGMIITEMPYELYWKLYGYTPKQAYKLYLDMKYRSEHKILWKLKRIILSTLNFWRTK